MIQCAMFSATHKPVSRFLLSQPWFAALSPAQQDDMERKVFTLSAARGAVILPANEPTQGWYGVLHGLVKISVRAT